MRPPIAHQQQTVDFQPFVPLADTACFREAEIMLHAYRARCMLVQCVTERTAFAAQVQSTRVRRSALPTKLPVTPLRAQKLIPFASSKASAESQQSSAMLCSYLEKVTPRGTYTQVTVDRNAECQCTVDLLALCQVGRQVIANLAQDSPHQHEQLHLSCHIT